MPTPEDVLSTLIQNKYDDVIPLIQTNPDFVNIVDPDTGFSLLQTVGIGSDPNAKNRTLIKFIVSHPKFDLSAMNQEGETNIDEIISSVSPDILGLVIKNPKILFNKEQLTYFNATAILKISEKYLRQEQQKDATSKACASETVRVEKSKLMVEMLRETTISFAIANARVDILTTMIQEPGVLFNKAKQLTYTDAKNALAAAQQVLTAEKAKDPKAKAAVDAGVKVANLTEMVAMLRDATIMHAIDTDDAVVFTQLKAAGAEPRDKLGKFGKEKYPNALLKQTNVRLDPWFKADTEQAAKVRADKQPHASNPNGLFADWQKALTALKQLEATFDKKQTALLNKAISGDLAALAQIQAALAASVPAAVPAGLHK